MLAFDSVALYFYVFGAAKQREEAKRIRADAWLGAAKQREEAKRIRADAWLGAAKQQNDTKCEAFLSLAKAI
ncbi:MAG: hypothetical protein E7254_05685 [Lachnospiraceae bacterium]|nr:hypothetical protein [Lachnospiraceae bacterium]